MKPCYLLSLLAQGIIQIPKDNFPEFDEIFYGLDFGYAQDPTAIVEIAKVKDRLYLHEVCYKKGMTNRDIAEFIKGNGYDQDLFYCDSAEPKSIEELRRQGFNVHPAMKGPDSIKIGIDILKRYDIMVTKRSTNLIKELRSYLWETDRDGKLTGKPIDHNNHAIDALRYIALNKLNNRPMGKYATIGIS